MYLNSYACTTARLVWSNVVKMWDKDWQGERLTSRWVNGNPLDYISSTRSTYSATILSPKPGYILWYTCGDMHAEQKHGSHKSLRLACPKRRLLFSPLSLNMHNMTLYLFLLRFRWCLVLTQRYNIPEQQYRDPGEHWWRWWCPALHN